VNRPSDAEKAALQIFDALGPDADISSAASVVALRELVEKTVHRNYALRTALSRGVAFHYGNMPLLIRSEIERLFREGVLRYLVCTSTLLEGVNLPCRNLFVRGPKKGNGKIMTTADFWNLAGRAGRWGKEFQGNIVCIDVSSSALWPEPPKVRVAQPIRRATDGALSRITPLRDYIARDAPIEDARSEPLFESVYSFLACRFLDGLPLATIPGAESVPTAEIVALEADLAAALQRIEVPRSIIQRHAGISPPAMQRLLTHFRSSTSPENLLVASPESGDAAETYAGALGRSAEHLGGNFGTPPRQYMLAILLRDWMRGYPLARLIEARLQRTANLNATRLAAVIRETMQDVESVARFEAPKFLACYLDLVRLHLAEIGEADLAANMPDLNMMLELGVSRGTEVTLMTLGLSRTSVIAVSEYIIEDDLSREQCLAWLRDNNLEAIDVPALVREELLRVRDGDHRNL
jgi:hypothetical protein